MILSTPCDLMRRLDKMSRSLPREEYRRYPRAPVHTKGPLQLFFIQRRPGKEIYQTLIELQMVAYSEYQRPWNESSVLSM